MSEVRIGEKIEEPQRAIPTGRWQKFVKALPIGEWRILEGIIEDSASLRTGLSRVGCRLRKLPDGRWAVYRKPPVDGAVS